MPKTLTSQGARIYKDIRTRTAEAALQKKKTPLPSKVNGIPANGRAVPFVNIFENVARQMRIEITKPLLDFGPQLLHGFVDCIAEYDRGIACEPVVEKGNFISRIEDIKMDNIHNIRGSYYGDIHVSLGKVVSNDAEGV
ncbi:predicted protein [Histoplasma capsulatum H143]|uniref:Uncharacterized protein n=1 Tax=Ajellomyces capsulatus (strain H143) TaxID=544712 RepID=C6H697_AJECH|nr:predicted protein [Histoplasma capsulatum H143]